MDSISLEMPVKQWMEWFQEMTEQPQHAMPDESGFESFDLMFEKLTKECKSL